MDIFFKSKLMHFKISVKQSLFPVAKCEHISTFIEEEIAKPTPLYSQVRNILLIKKKLYKIFVGAHF